jgi:hypothetical protein
VNEKVAQGESASEREGRENTEPRQIIIYRDDSTLLWHVVIHIIERERVSQINWRNQCGIIYFIVTRFRVRLLIESIIASPSLSSLSYFYTRIGIFM